ncbi:pH-response regulator protein [Wickerhamomyces ciferrii]|uniref:PH-response regulator protein n=1 Tax=Wickerhamomyces ciferrii (strain ATCC 14091 / BCRC 22168 / CBS 111 / JCM 3599 / NBRC 0793 / NRRL Y-1031 F-60-10) TaxID=1206466 RepID=K0K928_WICCF|nr:pH-response regulator protein [Wickerhamomyces ciferrii]CCH41385.1 pH-response regulator protein [Wickerhamomyces ciferrii]
MALAAFGCSTAVVVINAISLAFLILATITAPVVTSLGLAEADGNRFGVFGHCSTGGSSCSTATFPYDAVSVGQTNDWKMDDNARTTLSKILIVAPIAAGLTLISFIFNFFAHFKAFGSSLAFYLIGFIFTLLAFFASAVICIVTFLLFFPHVTWLAWLLIPATVLNLFAVPLVFFALRTTPRKFDDEEEDEETEDKNLTDLSDGDNFRSNNEFKLDDFTGPPNAGFTNNNLHSTSSSEKNIPVSSLKVITNDSSSINDQRSGLDKATIHDYSTNNVPTKNFNYNGKIQTQHYGNPEGTPNLVSSQNYGRGGAIRSEAPAFKPQSAKPDYSTAATSLYPRSAYQSTPPQSARFQQRPVQPPQRIQQPGYQRSQQGSVSSGGAPSNGPNSAPVSAPVSAQAPVTNSSVYDEQHGLEGQNVLGNSRHGSSANSDDYDNELNDNDSDFTSVSQRAVNPRYYRGANAAPTLFPNQEQQQLVSPVNAPAPAPAPISTAAANAPQQNYYPSNVGSRPVITPQQQSFPDHTSSYYSPSNGGPVSGQFSPQQFNSPSFSGQMPSQPPQQPRVQRQNTSDALLSTNPDFMISGPAFQKQNNVKRINPANTPTYRPAYKRNQPGANKISAASLAGDSPYNFK